MNYVFTRVWLPISIKKIWPIDRETLAHHIVVGGGWYSGLNHPSWSQWHGRMFGCGTCSLYGVVRRCHGGQSAASHSPCPAQPSQPSQPSPAQPSPASSPHIPAPAPDQFLTWRPVTIFTYHHITGTTPTPLSAVLSLCLGHSAVSISLFPPSSSNYLRKQVWMSFCNRTPWSIM